MDEVIQKQQEKDVENGIVQREYVTVKGAFLSDDADVEFEFKGDEEACDEAVEDLRNILEKSGEDDG